MQILVCELCCLALLILTQYFITLVLLLTPDFLVPLLNELLKIPHYAAVGRYCWLTMSGI